VHAADELSNSLKNLGLKSARLKTGTPPRLHKDSINYEQMQIQPGLEPPPFFSWRAAKDLLFHVEQREKGETDQGVFHVEQSRGKPEGKLFHVEQCDGITDRLLHPWIPGTNQMPCFLTHTTERTHEIIADNLKHSSLYGGAIHGTGVRYCPSIEDKIVKFSGAKSHHVFIEPEGRTTPLIYPNGTSNSLPEKIQEEMIHSIPGLERAEILEWGYAIEYDFFDPTQLNHSLECKDIENLFLAGQVNGTTGYEEAAAQGFVAGINAARRSRGELPWTLNRSEAYIGVLIDDLVTKGTDEPYRMFTSRAEHRLLLRQDNARFRLLEHAENLGIASDAMIYETKSYINIIESEIIRLD
jgi:tRNA uridine 5-carboxymethylaminomethyl modification enzyme